MHSAQQPREIDLAQVAWPFCLLELKCALEEMRPGQLLQVRVSDPSVYASMRQILATSPDRVLKAWEQGSDYLLTIAKG